MLVNMLAVGRNMADTLVFLARLGMPHIDHQSISCLSACLGLVVKVGELRYSCFVYRCGLLEGLSVCGLVFYRYAWGYARRAFGRTSIPPYTTLLVTRRVRSCGFMVGLNALAHLLPCPCLDDRYPRVRAITLDLMPSGLYPLRAALPVGLIQHPLLPAVWAMLFACAV